MTVLENVPLGTLTTFKVGGNARFVISCETEQDIQEAVLFAKQKALPLYVLGEGSNVLANDEGYAGVVILMRIPGISYTEKTDTAVVTVGAGVSWDTLVKDVASRGLWGIENLAGIPGTVGASPVQNIGAYGAELSQTLLSVDACNSTDGTMHTLSIEECHVGY